MANDEGVRQSIADSIGFIRAARISMMMVGPVLLTIGGTVVLEINSIDSRLARIEGQNPADPLYRASDARRDFRYRDAQIEDLQKTVAGIGPVIDGIQAQMNRVK